MAMPGTPKRIATRADVLPVNGAPVVHSFPAREHFEQDNTYWPNASAYGSTLVWEKWFWTAMNAGDVFNYKFDLPGADTTQAGRFPPRGGRPPRLSAGSDQPFIGVGALAQGFAPGQFLNRGLPA